jgi:hypothetical protein
LGIFQFYLNKQFQNTVCCTYFNIPKQFDATISYFQFELLKFGYSFGYISENWAIFSNFWSLCPLQTSVFTLPHGTTLTAFADVHTDVAGC